MTSKYNVYRNGEKVATGLTKKAYTDSGLTSDTAYDFQVTAVENGLESDKTTKLTDKTEVAAVEPEPEEPVVKLTKDKAKAGE